MKEESRLKESRHSVQDILRSTADRQMILQTFFKSSLSTEDSNKSFADNCYLVNKQNNIGIIKQLDMEKFISKFSKLTKPITQRVLFLQTKATEKRTTT